MGEALILNLQTACLEISPQFKGPSNELVWKIERSTAPSCIPTQLVWKSRLEISFGNFVWKFRLEILFGNFVWKTDRPTDRQSDLLKLLAGA